MCHLVVVLCLFLCLVLSFCMMNAFRERFFKGRHCPRCIPIIPVSHPRAAGVTMRHQVVRGLTFTNRCLWDLDLLSPLLFERDCFCKSWIRWSFSGWSAVEFQIRMRSCILCFCTGQGPILLLKQHNIKIDPIISLRFFLGLLWMFHRCMLKYWINFILFYTLQQWINHKPLTSAFSSIFLHQYKLNIDQAYREVIWFILFWGKKNKTNIIKTLLLFLSPNSQILLMFFYCTSLHASIFDRITNSGHKVHKLLISSYWAGLVEVKPVCVRSADSNKSFNWADVSEGLNRVGYDVPFIYIYKLSSRQGETITKT